MIALPDRPGVHYGFPYLDGKQFPGPTGIKFAWHAPARETDPDHVDRNVSDAEIAELVTDVKKYFPAAAGPVVEAKTCLYANTPDENFIVDFLPGYEKDVVVACGFSGHGFKFASVIGEILADLVINGSTDLPIGFLSLGRFTGGSQ
jgi:sarcosine oxidase